MTRDKARVYVEGYGVLEANVGENLGKLLASKNLLPLPCGGQGLCGQCRVVVVEGSVSEPTGNEVIRGVKNKIGERLACQTKILGDIRVKLAGRRVVYRPVLASSLSIEVKEINPLFRIVRRGELVREYVVMVFDLLDADFDSDFIVYDDFVVSPLPLQETRDTKEYNVLLVDLGTTKIAYQHIDLHGNTGSSGVVLNPLNAYGLDVMTRLSRAIEASDVRDNMRNILVSAVKNLVDENTVACIVAGNTVMESIFLGLPLDTLAEKPFKPMFKGPFLKVLRVGGRKVPCLLMPFIAGFVGGDAFSDLLVTEYIGTSTPYMIIDLGANTEIILVVDREEPIVYTTSTPAGPAFEGYVSHGMLVDVGGITRITIKEIRGDGKPLFAYQGEPVGITGSGLISLVAELLRNNLIDRKGRIVKGYDLIGKVKGYRIASSGFREIVFTQLDLREFQKALASVKTGWMILLEKTGLKPRELKAVYLAGRFGSSIDPRDAVYLKLIPPVDTRKVVVGGDMVLSGLYVAALDRKFFRRIMRFAENIRHVNLAEEKGFMEKWIRALELV